MFDQFFASFTRIAGFVEAFSTSAFTALHSSANFWILLKFSHFFLICSFHKNHRFSWGLPYLPVYCFFTNAVNFQIFCNFCNCMQTWTYLFYYYCVLLSIDRAVSVESTWWSALQIVTSKCQACARESNRTQVLFKRWIHNHYSLD